MGDPMLDRFLKERDQKLSLIDNVKQSALERGGDLTDQDRETITSAKERVAAIDAQIAVIGDNLEMTEDARERLSRVTKSVTPAAMYRCGGEVLYDVLHLTNEESASRFGASMKRAAEHMGTDKAKTVPVAGDLGGLRIVPVVGPVIDPYPQGMPFASALGLIESTNALHFMRPRIDDPAFYTSVGPQGSGGTAGFEKAELPSKAFNVTADPVSLATVGTYLNVSQQLVALQPGSLDLIVSHLLRRLAVSIDRSLITEMEKSTGSVTLAADADAATILAAIYEAAVEVWEATGAPATWIVMGPRGWARLGSLVDLAGRPLLPSVGAANAIGTASADNFAISTVAGLRAVVTPGIDDDTFWVGNGMVLEGYLYRFPVLEAVEPSVLGRQVAVAAATAGYRPIANGAIHLAP